MNLDTLYEMLYTHHVNDVYNDFENVNLEEEVVIIKRMVSEYVMLRVNIMCTLSCAPPMCVPRWVLGSITVDTMTLITNQPFIACL